MRSRYYSVAVVWFAFLAFEAAAGSDNKPDWSAYNALLQAHVQAGERNGISAHLVDYAALADDPKLKQAIQVVEDFDLNRLQTRESQLAFYINAYNLFSLQVVARHWPVESIRQIGSLFRPVWSQKVGMLGGQPVSLMDIEHGVLRGMNEPRIHFALAYAALSCADLRREAYTADKLDEQLNDQVLHFLSNPEKGMLMEQRRVHLSEIFSWFSSDFSRSGGVREFISDYQFVPSGSMRGRDLPFDWRVNSVTPPAF